MNENAYDRKDACLKNYIKTILTASAHWIYKIPIQNSAFGVIIITQSEKNIVHLQI